jgi:hypothetical protein
VGRSIISYVKFIISTLSLSTSEVNTKERQDKTDFSGIDYASEVDKLNVDIINFTYDMIDLPTDVVSKMTDTHIKDILNWKVLSDWGGVVADMDILFTATMGNHIKDVNTALICFENYPKADYIPVSFMYSSGTNKFFDEVYSTSLVNYNPKIYESCGTPCIKQKNLMEISKDFPELSIQRINDTLVFPLVEYPWGPGIEMLYNGNNYSRLATDSVGIHWYGGTKLSQLYNNKINHKNVNEINNTITEAIRRVLCHNHNSQK